MSLIKLSQLYNAVLGDQGPDEILQNADHFLYCVSHFSAKVDIYYKNAPPYLMWLRRKHEGIMEHKSIGAITDNRSNSLLLISHIDLIHDPMHFIVCAVKLGS